MPVKINHGVTLYKNNGSTTIKDPTNSPTQCALKPLVDGECGKDTTNTQYTSYRTKKGEDKFNTIISCSNHDVYNAGATFNDTFDKLTKIARKAKPEEGFPGVGASAMVGGGKNSQSKELSYAKKSGGVSLVGRTIQEIDESDGDEDKVVFKGRNAGSTSTVSSNATIKSSKISSPILVDSMSAVSIKDINEANSVYSNCNIAPSESASSVDTRNKTSKRTSNASSKVGRINRDSLSPSITSTNSVAKSKLSGFSIPPTPKDNSLISGLSNNNKSFSLLDSGTTSIISPSSYPRLPSTTLSSSSNPTRKPRKQNKYNNSGELSGQNGNSNRISVTINVGSDLTK